MKDRYFHRRKWWLLMIFSSMACWLHAQNNMAFYPFNGQFNSWQYNPAFLSSPEKFTFSLFPMAGMNLTMNNQALLREAARESSSGTISETYYKDFFDRLIAKASFHENVEINLLTFTYAARKGFFNFNIKDRQFIHAVTKGQLMDFIFLSDIRSAPLGQIQHFPVQSAHYREYSLGYAFTSADKRLSVGVRGKLYFGKYAFYSDIDALIGTPGGGEYGLLTQGKIGISFPGKTIKSAGENTYQVDFSKGVIMDYLFDSGNTGVGVDLGINYQVSEPVSVSLSVTDLGSIHWKKNLKSRLMDKTFPFYYSTYGVDTLSGVPTITKRENYSYADSFDFFDLKEDSSSFSKALPVNIYAGLKYQLNPGLSLSVTDRLIVMNKMSYNTLAMAANVQLNKNLSLSTGYSVVGHSYFNVPLALLLKRSLGQMYMGTDNLLFALSPARADYASFSFGACFYLFTHRNLMLKRSKYLPFYQPHKVIINRNTGLVIKARKKDR